jgi:poly-gamma-glutamate capsule biosynthesis protein CapA/YwtB (metallophosphatase superfamily)
MQRTKKAYLIVLVVLTTLLSLPSSFAQDQYAQQQAAYRQQIIDSVIQIGKKYLGKPYRYKAPNTTTLDCSGFICQIVQPFDNTLPHSSASMASQVKPIPLNEVRPGDLLFFKGRNINSSAVGHVSMVIEVESNGKLKMMHSCRRGIVIDDYPMSYYKDRFLMAGRIPSLDQLQPELGAPAPIMDSLKQAADREIRSIKVVGVGDLMIGTNFPSDKYLPPNDGKDILAPVHPILKGADLTFGNLEGVLLTGEGQVKKCSDPTKCYAFKSPDHYVNYYKEAGFDVLSVANNHVGDFGDVGRKNTVRLLNETGIHFAGLEDYPYTTFEKDGIRYGFCAFAPNTGTIKINDYQRAREIIQHLDSVSDIVIVSFHGGAEGAKYNRVTRKTEMFLGENRGNPHEFARMAIDAGADIVFGHGPHVVRAVDVYKDRFIAYSLGNFATYARFNLSGPNGLAPLLEVEVDEEGKFIQAKVYSAKQLGEGGPTLDETGAAFEEIKRLTKLDIPEAELEFLEGGMIQPK